MPSTSRARARGRLLTRKKLRPGEGLKRTLGHPSRERPKQGSNPTTNRIAHCPWVITRNPWPASPAEQGSAESAPKFPDSGQGGRPDGTERGTEKS